MRSDDEENERPTKRPRVSNAASAGPEVTVSTPLKSTSEPPSDDEEEDAPYDEPEQARASDLYLDTVRIWLLLCPEISHLHLEP